MFWCIETKSQLEKLSNQNYKTAFCEVISFNNNIHPVENEISLVYLRPLEASKGFILCLNHSESLSLEYKDIENLLESYDIIYVKDKKQFLHYFSLNNSLDVSYYAPQLNILQNNVIQYFYNLYSDNLEINKIIPIVKHYEYCKLLYDSYKQYFINERNKFNDKEDIVFSYIENCGFKVNHDILMEHYDSSNNMFKRPFKIVYSQYNLHTTTRRPSNTFNGINFNTLNKESGVRKAFLPLNELFIEIDFNAYHPYLISQLINYNFEKPIYKTFSDYSGLEIDEAKQEVFRNIYGNINQKYKDWGFFKQTQIYIDNLWNEFQTKGYIKEEISNHIFYKDKLENMNPNKLFNYWLQLKETSNNVLILWDLIKILKNKKTKISLYTFDAILFDTNENEQNVMEEIYNYFKNKNIKFKTKTGKNYNFS